MRGGIERERGESFFFSYVKTNKTIEQRERGEDFWGIKKKGEAGVREVVEERDR